MKKIVLVFTFILTQLFVYSQDSTYIKGRFFGNLSLGREIGDLTNEPNEINLQTIFGYKFNQDFGIGGGPGLIYYEQYTFLPIIGSIRRSPSKEKKLGYLFDMGYSIPIQGKGEPFQLDYKIIKGGSYFNPQIAGLLYDSKFLVYFQLGYRVYTFTQEYTTQFNPQIQIEERITARFINIGITVELK